MASEPEGEARDLLAGDEAGRGTAFPVTSELYSLADLERVLAVRPGTPAHTQLLVTLGTAGGSEELSFARMAFVELASPLLDSGVSLLPSRLSISAIMSPLLMQLPLGPLPMRYMSCCAVSFPLFPSPLSSPRPSSHKDLMRLRRNLGQGRHLRLSYNALASLLLQRAQGSIPPGGAWACSRLTQWLKPTLLGSAAVLVVATLSTAAADAAEALDTLGWASRLRLPGQGPGVMVAPAWSLPFPKPERVWPAVVELQGAVEERNERDTEDEGGAGEGRRRRAEDEVRSLVAEGKQLRRRLAMATEEAARAEQEAEEARREAAEMVARAERERDDAYDQVRPAAGCARGCE